MIKSNAENSTDHFREDIREHALAAVTNLGHVTPFNSHCCNEVGVVMWWLQRRTANTPGISSATTGGALSRSSCATVTRTAESQITATRPTVPVSNTRISLHYTVSSPESVVKLIALHILVRDGIKAVLSRQRQRSRQRGRGRGEAR